MKYGKIRNEKVRWYIDTAEDGGYTGQMFYEADRKSLKSAIVVIAEQKLKPIHIPSACTHPLEYYKFNEKTNEIIVYDEPIDEATAVKIAEQELAKIRARRAKECFPIINRGKIWYETLTELQQNELRTWYQEWLDAPATGTIPVKPSWIG